MKKVFRKKLKTRKNRNFSNFEKNIIFSINFFRSIFSQEISKIFEDFRFFQIFRKTFVIEKIEFFWFFFIFVFLSYLMPSLCKWHRATPCVPPVGAANASPNTRNFPNVAKSLYRDFGWMLGDPSAFSGRIRAPPMQPRPKTASGTMSTVRNNSQ